MATLRSLFSFCPAQRSKRAVLAARVPLFRRCLPPPLVRALSDSRASPILLLLGTLAGLAWLGRWVSARRFSADAGPGLPADSVPADTSARSAPVPLPEGLPAPVDRFYRQLYGAQVVGLTRAALVGRGWLRLLGLTWPMRFRFVHEAGRGFRSLIQVTLFGLPIMSVRESLVDGHGQMRTPFGAEPSDARLDQGSVLRLWAETATWLPSVLVTDTRVRWLPVDDATALLVVPAGAGTETFVARFDPATGWLRLLEAMRYRGTEGGKTLWLCEARDWAPVSGQVVATTGTVTWQDQGKPWAAFTVEEVVYQHGVAEAGPPPSG